MSALTPRTNDALFGHDAAERQWLKHLHNGRLAHGWLLAGPRGIGKATLAYRLARHLLTSSPHRGEVGRRSSTEQSQTFYQESPHPSKVKNQHPDVDFSTFEPPPAGEGIMRRVASGAHADLLVIEPEFNEKKGEQGQAITVEQAREIGRFLALTPAEGAWRVVVVDSADALNVNAANAILKSLEEPPPQAALLLVSHNPASLLPTIRSRCAMIKLAPLDDADFARAMRHLRPETSGEELAALAELSGGAPGVAAQYAEEGALALYGEIAELAAALPSPHPLNLHGFAESFGGGGHARFRLFAELSLTLLARASKAAAGLPVTAAGKTEGEALAKLAGLHSADAWAMRWSQAREQFSLAQTRHLDYKQVTIAFFHSIASPEGFQLAA